MGLEVATYIDDLVVTNPVGASDPKSEGDNHIRILKTVLKNSFAVASSTGVLTVKHPTLITGGTQTTDVNHLQITGTWNAAGVTFTGIEYNVTNTASAAASLLMDLQVGGTSQWKVTKAGAVTQTGALTVSAGGLTVTAGGLSVAADGGSMKIAASASYATICWNSDTTGDNRFVQFITEGGAGTERGTIDYNRAGGAVRYNTTSNAELKNVFGDADKKISCDILRSTRIREYAWKEDKAQKRQIGVISQEVYASGFKGAVNAKTWTVDKTAWNFHLIAGWQDHESRLVELIAWKAKAEAAMAEHGITIN